MEFVMNLSENLYVDKELYSGVYEENKISWFVSNNIYLSIRKRINKVKNEI